MQIARLVGGDGEKPGTETPLRIELLGALMDLQKGFLKDVLGRGAVAVKADQEMEQLALIALHQARKTGAVAVTVRQQKLLIAGLGSL